MLHGLLLVLKIAGIILAVLLGIVLAAAAAVLFVPVRYAADAQYDKNSGKKPVLHVRVTWLLHLFRFFMEYNEGFKMRAQVLFFPLYDSERPIEPEIKEQKEKASKKKQKAGERTVFDEQPQKSGVQAQEVRKRIEQEPPQETGSETEAEQTAEFFGARVDRFYDVGVSGIHRLFNNMDEIRKADCVIAVAGMEGALPTVIGGMVRNPVIAVPTSVGYGANMQGLTALLTMINSCANGVAVVNIDNGYGAGYMATQIGRLAASGRNRE